MRISWQPSEIVQLCMISWATATGSAAQHICGIPKPNLHFHWPTQQQFYEVTVPYKIPGIK